MLSYSQSSHERASPQEQTPGMFSVDGLIVCRYRRI